MGNRSDGGVEAFARESWNSTLDAGVEGEVVVIVAVFKVGGAGVTTSSRHWGVLDWEVGLVRGRCPVGVVRIWDVSFELGATDWKAWIGSASKNSWAKMKGILLGSIGRSVEL